MELILATSILFAVFALFAAAAHRFGVDSRPGSSDPRRPMPGLTVR
jgi:hypothetical protein